MSEVEDGRERDCITWMYILSSGRASVRIGTDDDYCIHARSLRENNDEDDQLRDLINGLPLSIRNPPPTMGQLLDYETRSDFLNFFFEIDDMENFPKFTTKVESYAEHEDDARIVSFNEDDWNFEAYRKSSGR